MGIFSSRRWMGLTPSVCTVLCFMLSACNSTDEPIEEALSNANPEMIHLSNGDVVVLSDTTTYIVDATEIDDVVMMSKKASEDLFGPVSRATTTGLRAYVNHRSSRAREFHPHPLTEPCVKVSPHTALHTLCFVHMLLSSYPPLCLRVV